MAFRVLGTLEVVRGAVPGGPDDPEGPGGPEGVPGPAPVLSRGLRRLLAALLVRADSVVAVDALADVVWGHELPVNVEAAMHNLVSRLRRALPGHTGTVLLTRAPGYLLQVAPGDLDSTRFEELASRGRADRADAPALAAALLDEAIGCGGGRPMRSTPTRISRDPPPYGWSRPWSRLERTASMPRSRSDATTRQWACWSNSWPIIRCVTVRRPR